MRRRLALLALLASFLPASSLVLPASAAVWQRMGRAPSVPSAIVFGSDGALWCGSFGGVWRSADQGQSWTYVKVDTNVVQPYIPGVLDIAAGPGGRLLVADGIGHLYRSTDGGAEWDYCTPSQAGPFWNFQLPISVSISATGTFHVLRSLVSELPELSGVWRSTNDGASWTQTTLPASLANSMSETIDGPDGSLYAIHGANRNPGPWLLERSRDDGVTWQETDIGHQPTAGYPGGRALWADADGHAVIGCYEGLAASSDTGATFRWWNSPGRAYWSVAANSSTILFAAWGAGDAGGVVWSADLGATWDEYSDGLVSALPSPGTGAQIRNLVVDDSDRLFALNQAGEVFMATQNAGAPARADGVTLRIARVAPNPSREAATVELASAAGLDAAVEVRDVAGRRVARFELPASTAATRAFRLRTRGWAPGVYLVRVMSAGRSASAKLMVIR